MPVLTKLFTCAVLIFTAVYQALLLDPFVKPV